MLNAYRGKESAEFIQEENIVLKEIERCGVNVSRASACLIIFDFKKFGKVRFDTNLHYAEDVLFVYEIYLQQSLGAVNYIINEPIYCYRQRGGSALRNENIELRTKQAQNLFYLGEIYQQKLFCNEIIEDFRKENTLARQYYAVQKD